MNTIYANIKEFKKLKKHYEEYTNNLSNINDDFEKYINYSYNIGICSSFLKIAKDYHKSYGGRYISEILNKKRLEHITKLR